MLDKLVYASIACGLAMSGAGVAYIVNFEGRIAKLEAQIGFISGAANGAPQSSSKKDGENGVTVNSRPSTPNGGEKSRILQNAIATGCANFMKNYNQIISEESTLFNSEKERLEALTSQMRLLGCDKILQ